MKVINPYSNEEVGEITFLDINQLEGKVNIALEAKPIMKSLSPAERSSILYDIIDGIKREYNNFLNLIIAESAKPYRYAKGEVDRAIQTFTIAAEEAKRLPHELFDIDGTANAKGLKGEMVYFPKGIVFGISPFNFPLNLAVHKIAPAIATGCPILLKPSSKTPFTIELLKTIIDKTNLPKGGFDVIHCSRENGDFLVQHPAIDVLSFTGSPNVGWLMKSKAGKKRVTLELGGNAAAILAKDANIDVAVNELLVGGFAYSGQVCIHTQRIYVHSSIKDEFTSKFIKKIESLVIDNPINKETDFSVMVDLDNAKRVESWVQEAIENGAICLIGGNRKDTLYMPTVLTNVSKGLKVREEEVFGPVVIIESFNELNEAIDEVNDSKWGLQASIFTDSISSRNQAFEALEVGGVIHNKSTTFRVDDMPYGGIKDSGSGREGVRFTMLDFLEPKLLVRE